jgi:hypothetical protein
MKRLGGIFEQVVAFDNLLLAFRKARRGKRRCPPVAGFELRLEQELLALQRELLTGGYHPGGYRLFTIYERKPRLIAAAPFRDRVVHHALLNVIEPVIDRRFIADSYACRTGKGTHAAVDRYQHWSRRHTYALKVDIARYFPSIDHALLKGKLRLYLKDARVLRLFDRIIDGSPTFPETGSPDYFPGDDLFSPLDRLRGIPIGNLTSQFLANLFLDGFDHFVKEELRVRPYLRYVDDKGRLAELRQRVAERLGRERLRLHPCKAHIVPVGCGLDFLGYTVFPHHRRLRNDNGWRFVRQYRGYARAWAEGRLDWDDFAPSVQGWIGHAVHAETWGLRERIFSDIVFTRGAGRTAAGG